MDKKYNSKKGFVTVLLLIFAFGLTGIGLFLLFGYPKLKQSMEEEAIKKEKERIFQKELKERTKKRLALRLAMDKIVFEEDEFVKEVEEILHFNESTDKISIINSIAGSEENSFANSNPDSMKQLISYLDKYFSGRIYRKKTENLNDQEKDKLSKWADDNKIDLSLFAMYKKLKKRITK